MASVCLASALRLAPLVSGLSSRAVVSHGHEHWTWLLGEALALGAAALAAALSLALRGAIKRTELAGRTDGLEPLNVVRLDSSSVPPPSSTERRGERAPARQRGEDAVRGEGTGAGTWDGGVEERVLPPGVGCSRAAVLLVKEHGRVIEEARQLQRGDKRDKEERACDTPAPKDEAAAKPMRLLYRHLWVRMPKVPMLCGMLCSIILTTASFCTPYIQGRLFDAAVHAAQHHAPVTPTFRERLGPLLGLMGALYGLAWAMEIAVGILFAVGAHTALTRLRCAMFANLVQQDVAFYDAHVSGELSSRLINDSGQLQTLVQFVTQDLLQAAVRLIGALVAMYLTHPLLALLATVVTPVNWLIIRRAGAFQGLYGVVQNAALAKANAAAVEALGAMRTIHANTGEVREAERFAGAIRRFLRVVLITVHSQTIVIFTQLALSRARDLLVLSVGMHQVLSRVVTIGAFTAFVQYVSLFEQGFSSAASIYLRLKEALVSAGRFVQLLERAPDVRPGEGRAPGRCAGRLELRDVTFSYPSDRGTVVLRGVTLVAAPSTVVALVGSSGAGKSTIARLVERFYDPTAGHILLDGIDYRELELRWLRQQIGFVEQEPTLFDRSLAENIRYGAPEASDADVARAAALANAAEFVDVLPERYETRPGEKGVRLSGGQKQRLAIARAVLKDPALLLLDEATSALDSANEATVQQALDRLMVDRTTLVIAHRLSTVVRASQILVLGGGMVLERGTHDELAHDANSHYAAFMQHQLVQPQSTAA